MMTHRRMRLTQATTSWLEGFEGLSRLMTPELMYDLRSRFSGEEPLGIGVKWPVRTSTGRSSQYQLFLDLSSHAIAHVRLS